MTAKCALPKEMDPSEGGSRPLYGGAGSAVPRFLARCHVPLNSPVLGLRRSTLYCKLGWPYPALGETEGATASSSCLKVYCPPRVPHSRNWGWPQLPGLWTWSWVRVAQLHEVCPSDHPAGHRWRKSCALAKSTECNLSPSFARSRCRVVGRAMHSYL